MNTARIDKKSVVLGLMSGPLFLFGIWVVLMGHQSEQLPGVIDYKNGHTQKAILELQQYVHDHPCSRQHSFMDLRAYNAMKYLGLSYLDTKQNQKAIAIFSDPCMEGDESQYCIGVALMRLGKNQEARIAFKKCIRLIPSGRSFNQGLYDAAQAKLEKIDKLQ